MKKQSNKLESGNWQESLKNFLANFFWAVVWLGRWTIKITGNLFKKIRKG